MLIKTLHVLNIEWENGVNSHPDVLFISIMVLFKLCNYLLNLNI
jgi:hypothetical protein